MRPAPLQPVPQDLPQDGPQSLPESLAVFIASLCYALSEYCGADRYFAPIGVRLWARLQRNVERFQTLFTRWQAGHLRPPRRRPARPANANPQQATGLDPELAAAATRPVDTCPTGFAWLVKIMPLAVYYRGLLPEVLAHPDLPAFLAAVPRAGRLLRPLCHMLGVHPLPYVLRPPPPDPDAPPRKPRTVTTTPRKLRFWIDRNGATGPRNALPEDLRWVRPVSLWV